METDEKEGLVIGWTTVAQLAAIVGEAAQRNPMQLSSVKMGITVAGQGPGGSLALPCAVWGA